MDKEKVIKKIKQGAPAIRPRVMKLRHRRKRQRQRMPRKRRRQKARQKVLLIWQTESIKEQEPVMPAR